MFADCDRVNNIAIACINSIALLLHTKLKRYISLHPGQGTTVWVDVIEKLFIRSMQFPRHVFTLK